MRLFFKTTYSADTSMPVMLTGDDNKDADNLQDLMAVVLFEACRLGATSIAFPLLGAGGANWSPRLAAKAKKKLYLGFRN